MQSARQGMNNFFDNRWSREFYQRHRLKLIVVQAIVLVAAGFLLARTLGGNTTHPMQVTSAVPGENAAGPSLWTCSMHPQIRSLKPGDCPICGMSLIPVTATSGGMRTLSISPETRALMNIASTPVERKYVSHKIPMVGKVDYNETKVGHITAWVSGRLDRLYVDYTGVKVNEGDHMVYIYSPELYSAQEELIQAIGNRRGQTASRTRLVRPLDMVESAREKLRLLGLAEEQIKKIEQQQSPSDHLTIYSPVSGIVIGKLKQEGDYVKTGERIYTVADLNQVWVHLDAYETDLPWIRYGQDVTITTEAYPGEKFHGQIAFIQPVLNDKTRTVKVRVNVPNLGGKLKPDMFVHAVVRPQVATGGRVMDPALAGKWISPMHPEIVKETPGKCDICGMPLVRAESLGYVAADVNDSSKPLVIPYSAALVTGTRAVVYVELPSMHSAAEPALKTLSVVVQEGHLEKIREAFGIYSKMLDRPYDQPGTDYARHAWSIYADRLSQLALKGIRVTSLTEGQLLLSDIESTMTEVREAFAPPGQPTFEGREIVLGPRAGDYYQVKHGLAEGELVVMRGNFKIDAEIQIQAKPSMMTPEGSGGHQYGKDSPNLAAGSEYSGHQSMARQLPAEFTSHLQNLVTAYEAVAQAIGQSDVAKARVAFDNFDKSLGAVDETRISGHPRMLWKEFSMLLGNDVAEASGVQRLADADRVFLLLKAHMRRLRAQLGVSDYQPRSVAQIAVRPEFQTQLARLWKAYLPIQTALAKDDMDAAAQAVLQLESATAAIDTSSLTGHAVHVWRKEQANLNKLIADLKAAADIKSLRLEFAPLSDEIGVLAKGFGFGRAAGPIYELHCPMAMQGRGAIWFQDDDQTENPYFGATMLKCADRVEQLILDAEGAAPDA